MKQNYVKCSTQTVASITKCPLIYSQSELCSYDFHPGRLHFLGSLFTYLYHTVMPIGRIIPVKFSL